MNYLSLFRRLAARDKNINYFRNLPGAEGEWFNAMYVYLVGQHRNTDDILWLFNRVRANYFGMYFQEKFDGGAATLISESSHLAQILTVVYFKSVVDPTGHNELEIAAERFRKIFISPNNDPYDSNGDCRIPNIKTGKFKSSMTPEIDYWDMNEKNNSCLPNQWTYWVNILSANELFVRRNYDSLRFIVNLFPKKEWKLKVWEALNKAVTSKANSL